MATSDASQGARRPVGVRDAIQDPASFDPSILQVLETTVNNWRLGELHQCVVRPLRSTSSPLESDDSIRASSTGSFALAGCLVRAISST